MKTSSTISSIKKLTIIENKGGIKKIRIEKIINFQNTFIISK
jgi:hypothetical protein